MCVSHLQNRARNPFFCDKAKDHSLEAAKSHGLNKNHTVIHFWSAPKENAVVLQLSTEALPRAVASVAESHCCGNKSLQWFPSKLEFCA